MNTAIIKPQWSPLTIALMVLGFVVFWPLGLAVLAYIIWGEQFGGSTEKAQRYMNKMKGWVSSASSKTEGFTASANSSGNAAFDEYRAQELRRLEEERQRLDEEIEAFHEHMRNLRMARDREEFDRFMADRRGSRQGYGPVNPSGDQGYAS